MTRQRSYKHKPVTEEDFEAYFEHKVEEWLEDGPEEVVRVLTLWATRPKEHRLPRIVDLDEDVRAWQEQQRLNAEHEQSFTGDDDPADVDQ